MKRVSLAVTMALFGATAHAQTDSSSLHKVFNGLAGRWTGHSQPIVLTYVVSADGIRIEGESCHLRAPEDCRAIDEGYIIDQTGLLHDYPNFGVKPVQIVELTDTKITRAEQNPVMANRIQLRTEELIDGGNTLRITWRQRVDGREEPKLSQQILLDRAPATAQLYSVKM